MLEKITPTFLGVPRQRPQASWLASPQAGACPGPGPEAQGSWIGRQRKARLPWTNSSASKVAMGYDVFVKGRLRSLVITLLFLGAGACVVMVLAGGPSAGVISNGSAPEAETVPRNWSWTRIGWGISGITLAVGGVITLARKGCSLNMAWAFTCMAAGSRWMGDWQSNRWSLVMGSISVIIGAVVLLVSWRVRIDSGKRTADLGEELRNI